MVRGASAEDVVKDVRRKARRGFSAGHESCGVREWLRDAASMLRTLAACAVVISWLATAGFAAA